VLKFVCVIAGRISWDVERLRVVAGRHEEDDVMAEGKPVD